MLDPRRAAAELVAYDPRIAESLLDELLIELEIAVASERPDDLRRSLEQLDVETLLSGLEELRGGFGPDERAEELDYYERQRALALALAELLEPSPS